MCSYLSDVGIIVLLVYQAHGCIIYYRSKHGVGYTIGPFRMTIRQRLSGADPGFVERGAQRRSRLKTLFGISKGGGGRRGRAPSLALLEDPLWNFKRGGAHAPCAPPPVCLLICPGPCNNLDPLLKFLYETLSATLGVILFPNNNYHQASHSSTEWVRS